MPPTDNNPAGRLYLLLKQAKELSHGNTSTHFPKLLNFDPGNTSEKLQRFAAVLKSVDEIAALLEQHDKETFELFQQDRASITNFFVGGIFNNNEWNQYKQGLLKEEMIRTLHSCSISLSRVVPEKQATEEELLNLESQLDTLYLAFADSDLDFPLKSKILEGLRHVKNAIHEYRISGAKGIEAALAAVSVTVKNSPELKTENKKDLRNKYWEYVKNVNLIFTFWHNLHALYLAAPGVVATVKQLAEKN